MNEYQLAQKFKKPINEIRKNLDYLKKHPYDLLQPKDPMFKKVWGKKVKRDKNG